MKKRLWAGMARDGGSLRRQKGHQPEDNTLPTRTLPSRSPSVCLHERKRLPAASGVNWPSFPPCDTSLLRRFGLSMGNRRGCRRGSNPRPSQEPQSADTCFQVLPYVAESAYLGTFLCSRLPAVSTCCVLSGVRSGVSTLIVRWSYVAPLGVKERDASTGRLTTYRHSCYSPRSSR
jgi:hypothetical protein